MKAGRVPYINLIFKSLPVCANFAHQADTLSLPRKQPRNARGNIIDEELSTMSKNNLRERIYMGFNPLQNLVQVLSSFPFFQLTARAVVVNHLACDVTK